MNTKHTIPALLLALIVTSCTALPDLHDTSGAELHVEGSWHHSLGESSMHNATVMLHHEDGTTRSRDYLSRPNGATVGITRGEWDVLVFNGVMESEQTTNLDHIFFRGTDRLSTFEACAAPAIPSRRLARTDDEYIASNDMELFTFAHHRVSVSDDTGLYVRYRNGSKSGDEGDPQIAGTIETTPRAMSFHFQIRMTSVVNPASARSVSGAMRGFLGSVFMPASGQRPRPGIAATHHLTLAPPAGSRTRVDDDGVERGLLVSQRFVSFGPPLPANGGELPASGQYFFEPVFVLTDGEEFSPGPIDVTAQVNATIARMLLHHGEGDDIGRNDNIFEITIDREVTLPVVSGGVGGDISVDPWDDTDVVIIWVRG